MFLFLIASALTFSSNVVHAGKHSSTISVGDDVVYMGEGNSTYRGIVKEIRPDGQLEILTQLKQPPFPAAYTYYGSIYEVTPDASVPRVVIPRKFVLHSWQDSLVTAAAAEVAPFLLEGASEKTALVFLGLVAPFMDQCSPRFCAKDVVTWKRGPHTLVGQINTIYRQEVGKKILARYFIKVLSVDGVGRPSTESPVYDYASGHELQAHSN